MSRKFVIATFFMVCILVNACSYKEYTLKDSDTAYAKARWADENIQELERGKMYYSLVCQKCHGLKNPSKFTEADWKNIMPDMQKKAKIADTTSNLILRYVLTARNGMLVQPNEKN
jgi:cytochrome c5